MIDWSYCRYFVDGLPANGPPTPLYEIIKDVKYEWFCTAYLVGNKVLWERYTLVEVAHEGQI